MTTAIDQRARTQAADMITQRQTRPVFITHAWRFHSDWNQLTAMLDDDPGNGWVNYSVPSYDPAIRVHSEKGKQTLQQMIYTQIYPCETVLFLLGPYQAKSSREWFDLELHYASELGKRVLILPPYENGETVNLKPEGYELLPSWDLADLADRVRK